MQSLRIVRRLVICLTLALALAALHAPAEAQPPTPSTSGAIRPGENPRRATGIVKALAGTTLAVLGSMTVVAGGLLIGMASTEHNARGNNSYVIDDHGLAVALGGSVALFYLAVPAFTALGVHGVAKARGVPGTYRGAWLGSLVTSATFGLPWLALNARSTQHREGPLLASLGLTIGHGLVSSVVGAMVGETWSRNRRLRVGLSPRVSGQRDGLGIALAGQF